MTLTVIAVIAAVLLVVALLRRLAKLAVLLVIVVLGAGGLGTLLDDGGPIERVRDTVDSVRDRAGDAGDQADVIGNAIDRLQKGFDSTIAENAAGSGRADAVDGDTVHVRRGGKRITVRVALVDAGESSSTRYGRPTCGGTAATRFAKRWVGAHRSVELRRVPGLPAEDRYERRLGRIVDSSGDDFGLELVGAGLARVTVYEKPTGTGRAYLLRLRAAQARARAARSGSWGACDWTTSSGVR